jgi:hypothetical protein
MADLTPDDSPTAIEGERRLMISLQNLKETNPVARSIRNFSQRIFSPREEERRLFSILGGANSSAEKVTFSGTTSTPFIDEAFFQSCRRKFQCRKDCISRTTSTTLKDEGFFQSNTTKFQSGTIAFLKLFQLF